MKDLAGALAHLRARHQYRSRVVVESPQGAEIHIGGKRYLSFCSNDYLGLANHPAVVEALREGARLYGAGSGASHLINGHSRAHHALEEELADYTGRARALLFSTGYMANLGVVAALAEGRGDTVFEDRLNHASLLDAAQLAGARLRRYPHSDAASLEQQLKETRADETLIVTDGVFSMDGDLAPLPALARLACGHNAWLMVDDAHGLGVLGARGGGALEHYALNEHDVPVLVGTLGKAFGTFGAFVAGSDDLIEYLIQRARTYIYTTALPPAVAHATRASLRLAREESWRREHLRRLIERFRHGAAQLGLTLMDSRTPIQPLLIGDSARAVALSDALATRGVYVKAIRPPTVPAGTARLRITFSAAHSEAQVDQLLECLDQADAHHP